MYAQRKPLRFLRTAAKACVVTALACVPCSAVFGKEKTDKPNIVLIMADDGGY